MRIEFFIPMIPPTVTHQEQKIGVRGSKPFVYEDERLRAARAKLRDHLAGRRPERPLRGAVQLVVKWCFPRGRHPNGQYRDTPPDTDNLQKLLKDVMTALHYWRDDAQVASETCEKFWAEIPGLYIFASEIYGDGNG